MRRVVGEILESIGALCALARLGLQTKFRLRGRYWQWRRETAFGRDHLPRAERRRATFHYARWVWRMGRYR